MRNDYLLVAIVLALLLIALIQAFSLSSMSGAVSVFPLFFVRCKNGQSLY